ncbi:MAG TPA: VOC family protein [Solirubrobacterales bacterium]|nr:VOC family protein [Solirubrobacterales bacterium]
MNSSIMWFTLSARDPDALASFYEHVLAWEVDEGRLTSNAGVSGAFRTLRTGGLGGSISTEEERGVVLMVQVDDLDGTLDRAREHGVSSIDETYVVEGLEAGDGRYRVAWLDDPAGNRLALAKVVAG